MRFAFGNLIHWRRHTCWQEKWKAKLWQQGIIPLTTIKIEVLFLLAFTTYKGDTTTIGRKRAKGLCYNCDNKYIKGHKCAEKKLFYIDCEEEEENDQETSKEEDIHEEPTPESDHIL